MSHEVAMCSIHGRLKLMEDLFDDGEGGWHCQKPGPYWNFERTCPARTPSDALLASLKEKNEDIPEETVGLHETIPSPESSSPRIEFVLSIKITVSGSIFNK